MSESRNIVPPENAERNRTTGEGGYTFNVFPPEGYNGFIMLFAVVRLGDHAHIEVQSGSWFSPPNACFPHGYANTSVAGGLILRWDEWVAFRHQLDVGTPHRIAEVERPTKPQLDRYTAVSRGKAA